MKTQTRPFNSTKLKPDKTYDSPTVDQVRRRAHEIFLARGGAPGRELDDWLRAEQQLKQELAGTGSKTAS